MLIHSRPDLASTFLTDPTFAPWCAQQWERNIGDADRETAEPCPACTDCNGNLCEECEAEWAGLVQDEGGGEG